MKSKPDRTTWRAVLIGLLLSVPHAYFSVQTPTPSTVSLIYTAVINLLLLALLNLVLKRWCPKFALSQMELLSIYTMLSLAAAIGGHDMMHVIAPILGHAHWFATPENEWQTLFFNYLPDWLVVRDMKVLKGFYRGESSFYNWNYVRVWAVPVLWWSGLLFALMTMMLGINTIIRRQWTERERLSYPIIRLPLEIAREGGNSAFFKNRGFWLGFSIAAGINLVNGLSVLFPMIPMLPIRSIEIGRYFTEKPLSAIGWTPICFFPFVIGLSYLMPLDLAFSCWFFYLFWKFQKVLGASLGIRSLPEFPYIKPQSSGAYLAIAVIALWRTRKQISAAVREALGKTSDTGENEPMSYRSAFICIIVGIGFLAFFSLRAGMSPWAFVTFFGFYTLLVFALTRLRAELGPPVNELYNIGPDQMLPRLVGTRALGPNNLTMFAMFWGFNRAHRCNPMPHQLEAFKLAEESNARYGSLVAGILLVSGLSILVSFWAFIETKYKYGFNGGFGWEAYRNLERWLYYMPGRDQGATGFMAGGFLMVILFSALRQRFLWWTLHPVAYPLASSWTMNWMWFPILLSWATKRTLISQGGISAYRRAMPFFLGLVLGEYLIGGMWNIYGVLSHQHVYTFWH